MLRACEVAQHARGHAEPNPTVGCVIATDDTVIAEGWTQAYGGDHAEVHAILNAGDADLLDATLYVTLEPCCHHGKTPPCTEVILNTNIKRVVVATEDPFPKVAGKGIEQLRAAGINVELGVARAEATALLAPYLKMQTQGKPWIIAKWAMTIDGKIATSTGDSQWISSPESRRIVHELRGRVDGVMVGIGTAIADDPLLTARPEGARVATRIVVDSDARLPPTSRLAKTASVTPIILAVASDAEQASVNRLENLGIEILQFAGNDYGERLESLLVELGKRRMTNVLVEGGAKLLGSLFDADQIDEVHAFVSPKLTGGQAALSPIGGQGISKMRQAVELTGTSWRQVENDIYASGRISK
jgi:diaminohydroxyphosphoribosylaminopyrimidine deaminase/5-amino-6-(5-phosphoribosylamino)uracil reductase